MRERWSRPLPPGGWTVQDAGLAGLCSALLSLEVLFSEGMDPRGWLLAGVVAIGLSVAWRRSWPGPVSALAGLGLVVINVASTGVFPPQLPFIPVLLLVFHAALRLRGAASTVWGVMTLALLVLAHTASREGDFVDFWPWLLWGGAWGAGTMARRHRDAAVRHATHAVLLEGQASSSAAESAERERDRIARELHDVVAHAVSVMVVQAGAERLRLGPNAAETGRVLSEIENSGRQALSELRTMLGVLRDADDIDGPLQPLPGLADVPALVERLRATGLDVRLIAEPSDLMAPSAQLPNAVDLAAYRIVQESLTNIVRHVGLVKTQIVLRRIDHVLSVEVRNEGSPDQPTGDTHGRGRGLAGMRERAAAVGGLVTAQPVEHGFLVSAVLPAAPEANTVRTS